MPFFGRSLLTSRIVIPRTSLTITAIGNGSVSTTQSKFGGASYFGDGTGDYLDITPASTFDFGTDNFTYECWFRSTDVTNLKAIFDTRPSGVNGAYPCVFTENNKIKLYYNDDFRITGSTTISVNVWYHMSLVKNSGTFTLYLDGTSEGTYANNDSITGTTRFRIGSGSNSNAYSFAGYIDEFRVSNIARYTTTFTPSSTAFSNDSDTKLLLHCDGTNGSTTFTDDIN